MRATDAPNAAQDARPRREKGALGAFFILFVFAAVFFGFGAAATISGIRSVSNGQPAQWPAVFGGLLFAVIGVGIFILAIATATTSRATSAMKRDFPDEPWRWKKEWASGRIKDDSGAAIFGICIFALLWNAIAWPTFILALNDRKIVGAGWLVLIFPVVGAALLATAGYMIHRRLKFGRCVLALDTFPGQLGGWLAGTIHIPTQLEPGEGIKIDLKCVNRVTTGSGKNSHTNEYTLWEDQQLLSGRLQREGAGLALPLAFQIPATCSASRDQGRNDILWRLIASASQSGADFKATFVVPVFAVTTTTNAIPAAEREAARLRQPPPPIARRAADGHIGFHSDTAGREFFDFPAARNPGSAAFLTIFGLIFLVIGIAVGYSGGPLVLSIVFTLAGALIVFGGLVAWFKARSIAVKQDVVELRWRMLGMSGGRDVRRDSITNVDYRMTSQSGNTTYYVIRLRSDGQDITAATGLQVGDARWIVEELSKALGVPASNMPSTPPPTTPRGEENEQELPSVSSE